jgi:hypothetical protein
MENPKTRQKTRLKEPHNTRRTSSRARSEETMGIAVRPRGSYRTRGKDLSNIGSKYAKVE